MIFLLTLFKYYYNNSYEVNEYGINVKLRMCNMKEKKTTITKDEVYPIMYNKKREFKTKEQLKELIRQICNSKSDTPISEEDLQFYTNVIIYILKK